MSVDKEKIKQLKALKSRLKQDITIVDVGCRWGVSDIWKDLEPFTQIYGFDADAEECDRLNKGHSGKRVVFVPKALAARSGEPTLYITENPACSSLYKPDPELTNSVAELHCAREVRTTSLHVTTLDDWAKEAGVQNIDFLKLDTPGSELDILRGAEQALKSVRALEVEVEFNPIYTGQPLFSDVDQHVRKRGFVLWKLSTLAHYSNHAFAGTMLN